MFQSTWWRMEALHDDLDDKEEVDLKRDVKLNKFCIDMDASS